MTLRALDAALWSGPWFGHKVVAMDWPCYTDPESGKLTAVVVRSDECCTTEFNPVRGPVYALQEPWITKEDGMKMAHVEPVPLLSATWEGFGLLMDAAKRRGFKEVIFSCPALLPVRCRLMNWSDISVVGDGDDERMAFALACAKACGIDVDKLKEESTNGTQSL